MRFHALPPFLSLESKWAWLDYKQCQNGLEVGIAPRDTLFLETKRFKYEVFIFYFSGFNRSHCQIIFKGSISLQDRTDGPQEVSFPARPSGCLRGKLNEKPSLLPSQLSLIRHICSEGTAQKPKVEAEQLQKNLSSRTTRVRIRLLLNKMARHAGISSLGK